MKKNLSYLNSKHPPVRFFSFRYEIFVFILSVLCFFLFQIFPQKGLTIVNIESLRKENLQRLQHSFGIGFKSQEGNTDKLSFDLKSHLSYHQESFEDFLFFKYNFGKTKNKRDVHKSLFHLRHVHFPSSLLALETFFQIQSNEFQRLSLRTLLGTGVRIKILKSRRASKDSLHLDKKGDSHSEKKKALSLFSHLRKKTKLHIGFGGFYSREKRNKETETNSSNGQSESLKEVAVRWNSYLSLKMPFNKIISLHVSLYFQPQIKDFKDYRLLEEASLETKVTNNFSLFITHSLSHDNEPPHNVKKTDSEITSFLRYKF